MTTNTKNISPHPIVKTEKSKEPDTSVGSYLICEKIGQGSFATVYKAQHKVSGHLVAIKSVLRSKLTKKLLENLESEISILKAIRHDHIVGLSECQKTDTHIHLVMDFCTMGDLSQYIKRIRSSKTTRGPLGGLPEITVRHFLKQLSSALRFLRSQNLVHRDIKPQNLLLVSPHEDSNEDITNELPILQVADFGFARFLPNASLADTLCGSPLYMGPEILSYKKYDAKADLWSVGAVLYEMITGRPPFRAQNHLELLKKIQENNDVIRFPDEKTPESSSLVGDDLKDLIRKLLKKDPVERISFEEFFAHPAILHGENSLSSRATPSVRYSSSLSPHPTTSKPITKHRHDQPTTTYETPPFAQASSLPTHQDPRKVGPISPPSSRHNRNRPYRDISNGNPSPIHSRGRSGKAVEFNDLHESGAVIKRSTRHGEEEDVLQEYVVLDRRIIETNQFADEINASPHNEDGNRQRGDSIGQVAIPRRKSSSSSDQTGYPPSSTSPNTPPFVVSRERRISAGTAGSALAKALSMASERLFGTGHSPPNYNRLQNTMVGSPRGFLISAAAAQDMEEETNTCDEDDDKTMAMIEKAACMGHAVAKFADIKFELLVGGRGGIGMANESTLAAEALVLHLKALALLELGFETAKKYWHRRRSINSPWQQQQDNLNSKPSAIRLNDAVQWMRERFNECLDRASFEKSKCDQYDDSLNGNNPCVEKLLYDRALEMSRAAAVHELVGENIAECEQDYRTAIWMLEAILEVCDDTEVTIEEEDRKIINKFIDSIQQRISVLRKKILDQKEQQYPYHNNNNNNNNSGRNMMTTATTATIGQTTQTYIATEGR
ncbi:kinase-like domain-containing protein [Halteromyces radiatus]|uniref:kinase-like domain-containing protein n=1 Tax=Halteromyces radiatus TaxID=101107 RepID=UPI00221FAE61|nr:kinase-like domain-containing protein [Halteromyces radiatus]KAI8088949.1 kinase-like domain-containing protein [Halteromyces radiatus]